MAFANSSLDVVEVINIVNPSPAFPFMFEVDLSVKILFAVVALGVTLFGLSLKACIFGYLMSASETVCSINGMIFFQQLHRILMAVYNVWFSVAYLLPFSLEDVFGPQFCSLYSCVAVISLFGDIFWSSALAVTRLSYIKCDALTRHKMGKYNILRIVSCISCCYMFILLTAMLHSDQKSAGLLVCTRKTFALQQVLYEYNKEQFWRPVITSSSKMRHISGIFVVLSTTFMMSIEIYCYIQLFKLQINASKSVAAMVNESYLQRRKQNNAITFSGEFITWVAEGWYVLTGLLVSQIFHDNNERESASMFRLTQFGVIPIIEIITSPPLRRFVKDCFYSIYFTPFNFTNHYNQNSS